MKNRPAYLFFALLLIVSVSAQENASSLYAQETGIVRVVSIRMEIDSSGTVSVTEELIVRSGDIVSIILPVNIQNLAVSDQAGNVFITESVPRDGRQLVSFVPKENGEEEKTIYINYLSQDLTGKLGDVWEFNYSAASSPVGTVPAGTIIKLITPKNAQITNISYKDFYWNPMGDSEIWIYPLAKEFSLSFKYRLDASGPLIPRPTSTTVPGNNTGLPDDSVIRDYLIAFIIFFAFLLVVVWVITFKKKTKGSGKKAQEPSQEVSGDPIATIKESHPADDVVFEGSDMGHEAHEGLESRVEYTNKASGKERRVKDSVRNLLDETERKIVELMEKFDEEITQAYVYKSTGIPKSSLSDTIRRLEKRNILERKKEGRTNWLKLKEDIFD